MNIIKKKQSPLQRINRIMKFYASRGINLERVNKVYIKIINIKLLL
jgi:chromosome segregation and condensation protein ScpB